MTYDLGPYNPQKENTGMKLGCLGMLLSGIAFGAGVYARIEEPAFQKGILSMTLLTIGSLGGFASTTHLLKSYLAYRIQEYQKRDVVELGNPVDSIEDRLE